MPFKTNSPPVFCLISDPPPVLRVDDRQRLARERREEREKQLGSPSPHSCVWSFSDHRLVERLPTVSGLHWDIHSRVSVHSLMVDEAALSVTQAKTASTNRQLQSTERKEGESAGRADTAPAFKHRHETWHCCTSCY